MLETGTGIVVPARNAHDLAQAIIAVFDHPDAYCGNPNQLVERSTPEEVAAEYEIAFELAIDRHKIRYAKNPFTNKQSG